MFARAVIEGIWGTVYNGMSGVLGMLNEAFELLVDSCGSGHGGVWDLLVCGV